MKVYISVLIFNFVLIFRCINCTEFIPVYTWSTKRASEKVPALHKISEESFKDDILERLKDKPFVIVFAEATLSPEDFAQHNQIGGEVFTHLLKLRKSSKVSYLPYVQNPIKALRDLDVKVSEVSVESLTENTEIPETDILIINLNDAKDSENRIDMLVRHDALVYSIYEKILKKHENILALYTAKHTSWVGSEDIVHSRRARALLEEAAENYFHNITEALIYFTKAEFIINQQPKQITNVVFNEFNGNYSETETTVLTFTAEKLTANFIFINDKRTGYYELKNPIVVSFNSTTEHLNTSSDIYAPTKFSYHCGDQVFTNGNYSLLLKDFQIQPFFKNSSQNTNNKFGDAYDCVGFTSVPIWSGLFVTMILLLILTFGITMMMDIRTMDRFDDAKGKTITINVE